MILLKDNLDLKYFKRLLLLVRISNSPHEQKISFLHDFYAKSLVLKLISSSFYKSTMTNTYGGKGDPPDPSKAYTNTDARSLSPPPVHRPKNDPDSPGIDGDNRFFVHAEEHDDVLDDALHSPKISLVSIDNNNDITDTLDALSNTTPLVDNAKNNQVSSKTDRDIQFFDEPWARSPLEPHFVQKQVPDVLPPQPQTPPS